MIFKNGSLKSLNLKGLNVQKAFSVSLELLKIETWNLYLHYKEVTLVCFFVKDNLWNARIDSKSNEQIQTTNDKSLLQHELYFMSVPLPPKKDRNFF